MADTVQFLRSDLFRLFNEGRVTVARYAPDITFNDPITAVNDLEGYVRMVRLLRAVFNIDFKLLDIGCTGPDRITTRWTMSMVMWALPTRPTLLFTGISVYKVDPNSGIILSHHDTWDAISNNSFFSIEGLAYVLRQLLRVEVTPSLETPRYTVLKAMADYELRQYEEFTVASVPMAKGSGPAGGSGFTDLAGYIFGGNAASSKMEMTTPVFTTSSTGATTSGAAGGSGGAGAAGSTMAFVMEERFADPSSLPTPNNSRISVQRAPGGYWCARRFSGWPLDFEVVREEMALRAAMLRDGLRPKPGYQLARYNDPATLPAVRRNEVLIEVEDPPALPL